VVNFSALIGFECRLIEFNVLNIQASTCLILNQNRKARNPGHDLELVMIVNLVNWPAWHSGGSSLPLLLPE